MVLQVASTSQPQKCESSFFSLDPNQSHLKPSCSILNTPLNFNPNLTFFGVTFNYTLFFKHYVLSLRKKFHSRFHAFHSIASASQSPSLKTLNPLFIPSSPMLPQDAFLSHLSCISPLCRKGIDPLED